MFSFLFHCCAFKIEFAELSLMKNLYSHWNSSCLFSAFFISHMAMSYLSLWMLKFFYVTTKWVCGIKRIFGLFVYNGKHKLKNSGTSLAWGWCNARVSIKLAPSRLKAVSMPQSSIIGVMCHQGMKLSFF